MTGKQINLRSGESMFHTVQTKLVEKEVKDQNGKVQKMKVPVPEIITGYHLGEMNPGDTIELRLRKYYQIEEVLERRDHKGIFPMQDENGNDIKEPYKKKVKKVVEGVEMEVEEDAERFVIDQEKIKGAFFKIRVKEVV